LVLYIDGFAKKEDHALTSLNASSLWTTYSITIADGHNWKFQRKMITRIFNVNAFREYVSDVFVAKGQKVVDYLGKAADEGTVVDINSLLLNFALDAFGTYVRPPFSPSLLLSFSPLTYSTLLLLKVLVFNRSPLLFSVVGWYLRTSYLFCYLCLQ